MRLQSDVRPVADNNFSGREGNRLPWNLLACNAPLHQIAYALSWHATSDRGYSENIEARGHLSASDKAVPMIHGYSDALSEAHMRTRRCRWIIAFPKQDFEQGRLNHPSHVEPHN
jgi:hypothetical protein